MSPALSKCRGRFYVASVLKSVATALEPHRLISYIWSNTSSQPDTTIVQGLNGRVWIADFTACTSGMPVRAITIENKGHGWSGLEEVRF